MGCSDIWLNIISGRDCEAVSEEISIWIGRLSTLSFPIRWGPEQNKIRKKVYLPSPLSDYLAGTSLAINSSEAFWTQTGIYTTDSLVLRPLWFSGHWSSWVSRPDGRPWTFQFLHNHLKPITLYVCLFNEKCLISLVMKGDFIKLC